MGVYPTAVSEASCPSRGCACRARAPRYPSDLTDAQWAALEPEARAAMAGLYLASRNSYHDTALPTGAFAGLPEDALDCAAHLYLPDPTG